jgi:hypothetical protein
MHELPLGKMSHGHRISLHIYFQFSKQPINNDSINFPRLLRLIVLLLKEIYVRLSLFIVIVLFSSLITFGNRVSRS